MALSFEKAMEQNLLSDNEIKRLAATVLASAEDFKPDLRLAAAGFGGKLGTFANSWYAMHKKLREAGCFIDEANEAVAPSPRKKGRATQAPAASGDGDGAAGAEKPKKRAAARKRKAPDSDGDADAGVADGEDGGKPKKAAKPRASRAKKAKKEEAVKEELDGDGFEFDEA